MTLPSKWYNILHPRPAYIIISGNEEKTGIMAASWVSPIGEEPPRVALAIDKESYTYKVILEVKDFTINVVFVDQLDLIWKVGTTSGWDADKVRKYDIRLTKSNNVASPRLASAEAVIESTLWKNIESGDTALVIADVVDAYVLSKAMYDSRYGWKIPQSKIPLHASGKAFTVPGALLIASKKKSK